MSCKAALHLDGDFGGKIDCLRMWHLWGDHEGVFCLDRFPYRMEKSITWKRTRSLRGLWTMLRGEPCSMVVNWRALRAEIERGEWNQTRRCDKNGRMISGA